jgi:beta-lactamase regulating signal transducer with metallopeptidase domain
VSALFAWLWQGAAIALAAAILLAAMRRLNAATRHAIWWCALGAVVVAPLVRAALEAAAATDSVMVDALPARVVVLPAPPDAIIAIGIGLWLGTLLVGFGKIATGLNLLMRLKSESTPLEGARASRLPMWQAAAADHRRPQLRVSQRTNAACVLGFGQPVILLSETLVDALDDAALDQVVMHEYAHLLRHDQWLRLLESVVVSVVGLHPAIAFIARQIDLEREAACDDIVVSRTGGAVAYAVCLTDAAALAGGAMAAQRFLAPSATGKSVSLRRRVLRLLDPRRSRTARLAPVAIAVGVLTVGSMLALSHCVAPIVVVDNHVATTAPPVPRPIVAQAAPALPATDGVHDVSAIVVRRNVNVGRLGVERQSVLAIRADAPLSTQLAPSEVLTKVSNGVSEIAPAPLASSSIGPGVHTPVALPASGIAGASTAADRREAGVKWSSLGAPGVAVGRGAKSVAGFFGGAAKAVAGGF